MKTGRRSAKQADPVPMKLAACLALVWPRLDAEDRPPLDGGHGFPTRASGADPE